MIKFIFMLTQHDVTRPDAISVYSDVRRVDGLEYVGFKDVGLPETAQSELVDMIHSDGGAVFLEVVSDTLDASLQAAERAKSLNVDYLIGTFSQFARGTADRLRGTGVRFMPYAGHVSGHPCVLDGGLDEIVADAQSLEAHGVDGLNVLAYRHQSLPGDAVAAAVSSSVSIPVVVAGSITSAEQIHGLARSDVWAFTVGGAVFEGAFAARGSTADNVKGILAITRNSVPS